MLKRFASKRSDVEQAVARAEQPSYGTSEAQAGCAATTPGPQARPLWKGAAPFPTLLVLTVGISLWFLTPAGLDVHTWHLFVIFLCTVIALVAEPLPLAGSALASLAATTALVLKYTGDPKKAIVVALGGFASPQVWLIVLAFFIAQGFVVTGLDKRLCYMILSLLGSSSLGLAFGIVLTEVLMAVAIPSCTARGAGIVLPILKPLMVDAFKSTPADGTERRIGSFLVMVAVHANSISSTLYVTGAACNPLIVKFAAGADSPVDLSWVSWFVGASVPCACQLILMPLMLYYLYPPEIKSTPEAPQEARQKLRDMGRLSRDELIMSGTFVLLVLLWVLPFETTWLDATTVALIGVSLLLITGVLSVPKDIITDKGAFGTLIWFGTLVMLAEELKAQGFFKWGSEHAKEAMHSMSWQLVMVVCALGFYISHYCFASLTAHVASLYYPLVVLMEGAGVPTQVAVRLLALCCCSGAIAQYTSATNPPFFALGYVSVKDWWILGATASVMHFVIFFTVGLGWWKLLGYY